MFFSYSYSPEIVQQIFDRQSSGYSALAESLRLPTKDYVVSVPQKFDLALQQYAKMIAQARGDYGIRAHRDLRQLAKALALMRALDAKQRGEDVDLNNVEVDFGDMAELNDIFQYLNFDCNLIDQDYPLPDTRAEESTERLGLARSSFPMVGSSETDENDPRRTLEDLK
jgi:hypothetical protein